MEKVSPEVLEMIFANLLSYKDSANASKVCTTWRDVLHSTRRLWLFSEVFPLILEFLEKREIFVCRLVCKHWCLGVEHVLENSVLHRPPAGLNNQRPEHHLSVRDIYWKFPIRLGILYHNGSSRIEGMKKMLVNASEHTRNPVLGRSVFMDWGWDPNHPPHVVEAIHLQFLRTFGRHIWFFDINIGVSNADPDHLVYTFKHVLEMLSLLPNLKKLAIIFDGYFNLRSDSEMCPKDVVELFNKHLSKNLTNQETDNLPKMLETLDILDCSKMFHALIPLLANSNLRSLHLSHSLTTFETLTSAPNLVDINVQLGFVQLPKVMWPLQRLQISIDRETNVERLFQFVNIFQKTLCHLQLTYGDCALRGSRLDRIFEDREALVGCQNLKRVTLQVFHPFRLDFLCGLAHSLEYLHILTSKNYVDKMREDDFGNINLFKYIKIIYKQRQVNQLIMYESNVWNIFPKLRLVTVRYTNMPNSYEYRKQVYDKLHLAKKSHPLRLVASTS